VFLGPAHTARGATIATQCQAITIHLERSATRAGLELGRASPVSRLQRLGPLLAVWTAPQERLWLFGCLAAPPEDAEQDDPHENDYDDLLLLHQRSP
jgi:hypothetical protein